MEGNVDNELGLDDDQPRLSEDTMKALLEFYAEQETQELSQKEKLKENLYSNPLEEEWNFSQFWYTEETAEALALECKRHLNSGEEIVCISCPTIYRHIKKLNIDIPCKILEYDNRFEIYGSDFIHYDYKKPLLIPPTLKENFSVVIADPPYLNDDCLTKTALTIKFLAKPNAKIILCTGAIMEEMAQKLLKMKRCEFPIKHSKNLSNPFACYANYDLDLTCKAL